MPRKLSRTPSFVLTIFFLLKDFSAYTVKSKTLLKNTTILKSTTIAKSTTLLKRVFKYTTHKIVISPFLKKKGMFLIFKINLTPLNIKNLVDYVFQDSFKRVMLFQRLVKA